MKKILYILLSLVLSASMLQAAAFEKEVKSRSINLHIHSDKPLTVGSNTLVLNITQNGNVLKDATVSLKAFMPAMPGMPAMHSKTQAKALGDGKYEATVNLAMRGTWQLHIFITPTTGKKSRVKTSLDF